ncbi:DUF6538 domain-containing protein [Neptuniibacter pectenicola]|uniref:DUF6538 domain-containing protein n=1 Tax=Neptuniibacter pectenicola TaxID=1806669 RepID=A0ABU9TW71_9GAMM
MKQLPHCYVSRHGIYYARLLLPATFRQYTHQKEIRLSLRTSKKLQAFRRYSILAAQARFIFNLFNSIMTNKDNTSEDKQRIWEILHLKHNGNTFEVQKELINKGIG